MSEKLEKSDVVNPFRTLTSFQASVLGRIAFSKCREMICHLFTIFLRLLQATPDLNLNRIS